MAGFLKRLIEAPDVSRLRRRADQDPSPKSTLELVRRLQMQGRSSEATEVAREGLLRFPFSHELRDILHAVWRLQCRNDVEEHLDRLRSEPTIDNHRILVDHFLSYGELEQSARWADHAVAEFPTESEAAFLQATVYDQWFRLEHVATDGAQAIKGYRRAIELRPGALDPHLQLAKLYAYVGSISKALHHAFKALDIDGSNPEANALQRRLSQMPLEKENESDLLRQVEENDGPPRWDLHDSSGYGQEDSREPGADVLKAIEQLSSMTGVRRLALSHDGIEMIAIQGRTTNCAFEGDPFLDLARGFRTTAGRSSKRMGIGGFQEAEICWNGGSILALAAGPSVLLVEVDAASRLRSIASEARNFLAFCTQIETAPVGGGAR